MGSSFPARIPRLGDEILAIPHNRFRAYIAGTVVDVRDHGTTLVIDDDRGRYLDTIHIAEHTFHDVRDMPLLQAARRQLQEAASP